MSIIMKYILKQTAFNKILFKELDNYHKDDLDEMRKGKLPFMFVFSFWFIHLRKESPQRDYYKLNIRNLKNLKKYVIQKINFYYNTIQ